MNAQPSRGTAAITLWVLAFVMAAPALAVAVSDADGGVAKAAELSSGFAFFAVGAVGLLLATRMPRNPIGWVYLAAWTVSGLSGVLRAFARWSDDQPGEVFGSTLATWMSNWLWVPTLGLLVTYPLMLFPTGRVVGPRWRSLPWVAGIVIALWSVSFAFSQADYATANGVATVNPFASSWSSPVFDDARFALAMVFIVIIGLCVASLVVRFRGGDATSRAQLKWLMLAGAVWVVFLLYPGDHGVGGWIDVAFGLAAALLPIATGVAIFRYHLYDIDRVISRTTSYTLVTGLLLGSYAVIVAALSRLFSDSSSMAVAIATLCVAAVARPLLRWVQDRVDRRFNRARFDAEQTIESFAARLRDQVDSHVVRDDLLATVTHSLEPATASLWVRADA